MNEYNIDKSNIWLAYFLDIKSLEDFITKKNLKGFFNLHGF